MQTVNSIRLAVRGKRGELGLSQEHVAQLAGVSRKWLSEFEQGKVNVDLGLVLRVLEVLDLEFSIESKAPVQRQSARKEAKSKTKARTIDVAKIDLDALLSGYQP